MRKLYASSQFKALHYFQTTGKSMPGSYQPFKPFIMQSKFTKNHVSGLCARIFVFALVFALLGLSADAQLNKQNPGDLEKKKNQVKTNSRQQAVSDNDAGIVSQASRYVNGPEAICTTWTISITGSDPTTSQRSFRDGVPKTCAAPGTCTNGINGTFNYKIFQWVNPVNQCVTVTYSATNASFSFVSVHNAPPTLGNTCANWVADPGSSATVGTPIVFSFNGTAGTTYYFFVTNVGAVPSNLTLQIDAAVCSATPCGGTPNPGNPVGACVGNNFTLSLPSLPAASGYTYQWQSAPAAGGPWTNASGTSTNPTYVATSPAFYRALVTCTNSSQTGTSGVLQVTNTACYCVPTYSFGCSLGDHISRVRLGTLDNASACSTPPFTYYSAVPAPTLIAGGTYQVIVNVGPDVFGQHVGVWIDYDQNGIFNTTNEWLTAPPPNAGANGQATITFTVPVTATVGTTRMRIRGGDDGAMTAAQSCGASNSAFGEAEDYNVTIAPCIQGTITQQPVSSSIQCGQNTTFTVNASGSLISYFWEYRVNASSPWQLVPNSPPYSGANTNTLTLTNVPLTLSGYQYRAIIQGPCTATDFSNVVTLTVSPVVPTVTPASANICSGQIQQLRLTNVLSAPPPVTQQFCSGPLSLAVPDNTPNGVNHSIPVSLPAGSSITNIQVTINMTHTWDGDMVFVLRAPNGQILNLDYFLTQTGGTGPTTGFTNTRISSTGTAPLSSGTNPYNGIFRADAAIGTPPFGPAGPTGFAPTVTTWAPLYGTTNGNWTLAMWDGGPADLGVLTSWCLDISYTSPTLASGVWTSTPALPNTMFTDPAATIPYTGTPVNTIYVRPTVNTTYCVSFTTTTPCTSTQTCVPVNVFNPVTNLQVTPSPPKVCVGDDITLSATAGGGPISWQWEVSTNGGLTWTPIAGATSSTLTLNDVTASMNNNRYRVTAAATPCASSLTSAVQVLKVDLLPVVTISSPVLQITPGQTTTITATSDSLPLNANSFTWFLNGGQLSSTGNTVVADMNSFGNYQVTVVDENGCVGTSNVLVIGGQGTDRLWIFPNPTNDGRFQVRLFYDGVQLERRKVVIYTMKGQKVHEQWFDLNRSSSPFMEMSFDLRHLPNGTYVVKVNEQFLLAPDEDVKNVKSGLLIIQR